MPKISVYHNSRRQLYREPFGAVPCGAKITLRLFVTGEDADKAEVELRTWDTVERFLTGTSTDADGARVFEFKLNAPKKPGVMWYNFRISVTGGLYYIGAKDGVNRSGECELTDDIPHDFRVTVYEPSFTTPEAFKGEIAYQIFPDRFAIGAYPHLSSALAYHRSMGRRISEKAWNEEVDYRARLGERFYSPSDYYFGNLRGIRDRIPYLKTLGVTVLYLNPIFESPFNHRYSISDYMRIDPLLGSEDDFQELCASLHRAGIKLILDGVFSHTGDDSRYFDRKGIYGSGAYGSPASPYRDWYDFSPRYKHGFRCWWDFETLPEVNELTPSYMDFIAKVMEKWIRLGADGWRLDVADELPDEFIKFLRTRLKAIDPEALLIGEVWEDASLKTDCFGRRREYVNGLELDGVMDYPFMKAVCDFLVNKLDSAAVLSALASQLEGYPSEFMRSQLGFLGSHDTFRVLSVLSGAPLELTREEQAKWTPSHKAKELGKKRLMAASALQFSMPFTPCVYYGDEAGLEGLADPFCRKPYPWGHEDEELLAHYRRLAAIRSGNPVFKNGKTAFAAHGKDVFCIARMDENEEFLTVVNRGEEAEIKLSPKEFEGEAIPVLLGGYLDVISETRAAPDIGLTVPAHGFVILKRLAH